MSKDKKVEPETTLFRTFAIKGLDLRDYFAAKAMQALINSFEYRDADDYEFLSHYSYKMADAMLAERDKGE